MKILRCTNCGILQAFKLSDAEGHPCMKPIFKVEKGTGMEILPCPGKLEAVELFYKTHRRER